MVLSLESSVDKLSPTCLDTWAPKEIIIVYAVGCVLGGAYFMELLKSEKTSQTLLKGSGIILLSGAVLAPTTYYLLKKLWHRLKNRDAVSH